jgi:hypothetical protein
MSPFVLTLPVREGFSSFQAGFSKAIRARYVIIFWYGPRRGPGLISAHAFFCPGAQGFGIKCRIIRQV